MKKSAIIQLLFLVWVLSSPALAGIYVDQVGYRPSHPKFVYVDQPADSFSVVDVSNRSALFKGKLAIWKTKDPASGMTLYRGDFSAFTRPGLYTIRASSGEESQAFSIQDTVYRAVWKSSLKGFFFQRCGTALGIASAGVYTHPVSYTHLTLPTIYSV